MNGPKLLVWGLAGVIVLALGIALTRPAPTVREDVDNAQLRDLQADGARLVDVRSPGEYALGHIPGAENVPVEEITRIADGWDKASAVIVCCASGSRSSNVAAWLAGAGFRKVYNLRGGLAAWDGRITKDASAPVARIRASGRPVFIDFYSDS